MFGRVLTKLWHGLLILCISFIIIFAITISAMRVLLPKLQHHAYLERVTTRLLKTPVHIAQVDTDWYGLQPRLILHHVALYNRSSGKQQLLIDKLVVQVNLLSSLVHWQLLPSQLTIDGASLAVGRDRAGHYYMRGLKVQSSVQGRAQLNAVINWLLTQANVSLVHIKINFLNRLQLTHVSLHLQNDFFEHHVYGHVSLAGKKHTQVKLIAELVNNDDTLSQIDGNVYLSIENLSNSTFHVLQQLAPQLKRYPVQELSGGMKLWLGISASHLKNLLAYYALNVLQTNQLRLNNAVGQFSWNQQQTIFHLNNQQALLTLPSIFEQSLQLGHITLNAHYNQSQSGWKLVVPQLSLSNQTVNINSQLQLIKSHHQPLLVDFISGFAITHLSDLARYVPIKILKPDFARWLKQAFVGGSLRHGELVYRGPLVHDALAQHRAQFQLQAQFHQLKFSYAPHWPLATEGEVNATVSNNQLAFNSNHIYSAGVFIDHLHGLIPLQPHSVMTLSLHSASELNHAWGYIEATPLPLATQLKALKFAGPMDLNFKLRYPLHPKPHHDVDTHALLHVHDASLELAKWGMNFEHINGGVIIHNQNLTDIGKPLHASLFGNPIQIHIKTKADQEGDTVEFDSSGRLSATELRRHFPLPLGQFFSGSSQFAADLALHHPSDRGTDLHITTDLVGVSSQGLPSPFNKKSIEHRPLKIDVSMRSQQPLYLKVRYAKLASAALIYDRAQQGLSFRSGDIELGDKEAHFVAQPGLIIRGNLVTLDWDNWQHFLDEVLKSQQTNSNPQKVMLRSLSLQVKQLNAYHHQLRNIHLTLIPLDHAWQVGLRNKQISGFVQVPQDHKQLWVLQFTRLYLPKLKSSHLQLDPATLPPLQVNIDDFSLGKNRFGQVVLQSQPISNGLNIKQLSFGDAHYTVSINGNWTQQGSHQFTALMGGVHTTNLGDFLYHWHNASILGGQGKLGFSLQWPGSPFSIPWGSSTGTVSFDFENGSLVALDSATEAEIGLGKLLNLLSVDAIVKRLETHFHDLTQKGLWFDHFKGVWVMNNGVATTHNTYLDGPVAKIIATGHLDFAKQSAAMMLDVTPQLTSSIPAVVGIIGGPIAGVATWVVNRIVGPQIDKISESRYWVTGPWKHLKINKIH